VAGHLSNPSGGLSGRPLSHRRRRSTADQVRAGFSGGGRPAGPPELMPAPPARRPAAEFAKPWRLGSHWLPLDASPAQPSDSGPGGRLRLRRGQPGFGASGPEPLAGQGTPGPPCCAVINAPSGFWAAKWPRGESPQTRSTVPSPPLGRVRRQTKRPNGRDPPADQVARGRYLPPGHVLPGASPTCQAWWAQGMGPARWAEFPPSRARQAKWPSGGGPPDEHSPHEPGHPAKRALAKPGPRQARWPKDSPSQVAQ
jgi:hypothetical protein